MQLEEFLTDYSNCLSCGDKFSERNEVYGHFDQQYFYSCNCKREKNPYARFYNNRLVTARFYIFKIEFLIVGSMGMNNPQNSTISSSDKSIKSENVEEYYKILYKESCQDIINVNNKINKSFQNLLLLT